jgi:drug/metabolite transporter (DMT)-like permease
VAGTALGVLVLSTAAVLVRIGDAHGARLLDLAAGRLTVAALIVGAIAVWRTVGRRGSGGAARDAARPRRPSRLAVVAGACLAIHFASWFASLGLTSVASSVVLVTTSPIFVALASPLILGEALTRSMVIGLLAATGGGILIVGGDAGVAAAAGADAPPAPIVGNALALLGAVSFAAYIVLGRRARSAQSLGSFVTTTYVVAALLLLPAAALWHVIAPAPDALGALAEPAVVAVILGLALGPQLIGHTTLNWALRRLPAAFVAVAVIGEPVGAVVFTWMLDLAQPPVPLQVAGAAAVFAGIVLTMRGSSGGGRANRPVEDLPG